jgi:hypothetical protein
MGTLPPGLAKFQANRKKNPNHAPIPGQHAAAPAQSGSPPTKGHGKATMAQHQKMMPQTTPGTSPSSKMC